MKKIAVVGYGVIGKRIAHAVSLQDDMTLVGVCDIVSDWRIQDAIRKGFPVFSATPEARQEMEGSGVSTVGGFSELVQQVDLVVDCTPKKIAEKNIEVYKERGVKFIVQGGEKHETTGHSFHSETNFESAVNINATRVVSCNTTSILRTLGVLKKAGLLVQARGTLLRRATDPWESHKGGIMNTLLPEPEIPSHQGRMRKPSIRIWTSLLQR